MKVVIVGGVAGGATAAARLRRLDEHAQILLLERGPYITFANCGLPYYIGGEITDQRALTLQTPQSFSARFAVEVRVEHEVLSIDRAAKTVTVRSAQGTYTESYDKLLLSPGAAPIVPPIPGLEDPRVFTLRNIPDTERIKTYMEKNRPRSAVVVGGGFIGLEMAENLHKAGLQVTVVEKADQVLAPLDPDMACDVHHYLRQCGLTLLLGVGLTRVEPCREGVRLTLGEGDAAREVVADLVLLAIGVQPESGLARAAGLALNQRGAIRVNTHMATEDPDIYAVGDAVEVADAVTGLPVMVPLAGPANKQGRIAADNLCGIPSTYEGTQGSAILRCFDLTVAATGINEKTAKRLSLSYEKSFTYSGSHAGYYPGAHNISIKTLFDRETGKLLGAQIVGFDGCDKRCDVLATALRLGATAQDLTRLELCYAPPFSSAKDPVNMAGYVMENVLAGRVKLFHWHDVAGVLGDPDACLLDVRNDQERARSHIEGSLHIPLDVLRGRMGDLDPTKRLYVHCHSGLRSYLACVMLTQHGYDCYNLSGGYRLYASVLSDATGGPSGA